MCPSFHKISRILYGLSLRILSVRRLRHLMSTCRRACWHLAVLALGTVCSNLFSAPGVTGSICATSVGTINLCIYLYINARPHVGVCVYLCVIQAFKRVRLSFITFLLICVCLVWVFVFVIIMLPQVNSSEVAIYSCLRFVFHAHNELKC